MRANGSEGTGIQIPRGGMSSFAADVEDVRFVHELDSFPADWLVFVDSVSVNTGRFSVPHSSGHVIRIRQFAAMSLDGPISDDFVFIPGYLVMKQLAANLRCRVYEGIDREDLKTTVAIEVARSNNVG